MIERPIQWIYVGMSIIRDCFVNIVEQSELMIALSFLIVTLLTYVIEKIHQ